MEVVTKTFPFTPTFVVEIVDKVIKEFCDTHAGILILTLTKNRVCVLFFACAFEFAASCGILFAKSVLCGREVVFDNDSIV